MKSASDYPLNILIVGMHHHGPQQETINARKFLKGSSKVLSYGSTQDFEEAYLLISNEYVNVIFLDPWVEPREGLLYKFIKKIRKEFPSIVVVLYSDDFHYERLLKSHPRLSHYFRLDSNLLFNKDEFYKADEILIKCQESLYEYHNFDIAISFAGEDRDTARELANEIKKSGSRVFFDEFFESELLGKDLFAHLHEIYSNEARYCIMLISKNYILKKWTSHERMSAQSRALENSNLDYILPVRIDNSKVPGLFSTLAYLTIDIGIEKINEIILGKVWLKFNNQPKKIFGKTAPGDEHEE